MASIAIITARGGSKRIPRKNIKDFCGKPIMAYSIEAALDSGCFDEVMVSTDDEEIAEVARRYGASVPFMRSEKTSDDYATTADVLLEVIDEYKKRGQEFEYMCCIYPTAPFVTGDKLKEAMDLILANGADRVAPFVRFSIPPQWRASIDNSGFIHFQEPETVVIRSQDLEPMYYDPGQFYLYKVAPFLSEGGKSVSGTLAAIKVPEMEAHDIDTIDDWKMAEIKYNLMVSKENR